MTIERDQEWRAELIELVRLVHAVIIDGMREADKVRAVRWHATMDAKNT